MRISCLKDDPGHVVFLQHGGHKNEWAVQVDGKTIEQVVTLDTGNGWVLRNTLNALRQPYIDPLRPKQMARHTVTGNVVCEVRDADTGTLLAGWATEAGT